MEYYKNLIFDIETPKKAFLCCFKEVETGKNISFEINEYKNELYSFMKYLEKNQDKWFVGWNNLNFDGIVIEYIWRNHQEWYDKTWEEICELIYKKASTTIDNSKYEIFPEYKENQLSFKQIDLFKLHHLDNKNRISNGGLKSMEYYLDMDVETYDFSITKEKYSKEELEELKRYCFQDIEATYQMYLLTLGDTENPIYKGNNQIEYRLNIEQEFDIPCLNYSNSKIGDEIIKKYYCEAKKIDYKALPKKGTFRKSIPLKYCIPKNIEFKTPQLQEFLKRIKKIELKQNQDFEEEINFYGQVYSFKKGGIHNKLENKIYESTEDVSIIDLDVNSFYSAVIIGNSYYPYHLGKAFLEGYTKVYYKRIELKPLQKNDKKIKGIVLGLKDCLNCPYGKSSDMQSWLFDKAMTLSTCISGELSLLMLIEQMELNDIQCIMANTDGASFLVKKELKDKFNKIVEEWTEKLKIVIKYETEIVEYKKMIFSTVNDYWAVKMDGTLKKKGDALTDFEIFKNKSFKVIPLALEAYFVNGVKPEEFLKNHKNIYDFMARGKVTKDFFLKTINKETGEEINYNKLLRYYIAKDGVKLYKVKKDTCETNAAKISEINAGSWLSVICNTVKENEIENHFKNLDFQFYLDKINTTIIKIEKNRKINKTKQVDPNQILLF